MRADRLLCCEGIVKRESKFRRIQDSLRTQNKVVLIFNLIGDKLYGRA